jgi:hypothetical protein
MRYLIQEYVSRNHAGCIIYLVTDDGDELTAGSLWSWFLRHKRTGARIAVCRLCDDVSNVKISDQILIIDREGNLITERSHDISSMAELKADPSIECYRLERVLDLS